MLAYQRRHANKCLLIALNLGDKTRALTLPTDTCVAGVLCSTLAERPLDDTLAPNEGVVLRLKEKH